MNRDDVIRWAREAAIPYDPWPDSAYNKNIERFAALVAAAEREAFAQHCVEITRKAVAFERESCAKVCESMRPSEREFDQRFYTACTLNANAIRARGQA